MRICLRQNDDELDEEKSDSNSNIGSCDSELADSTFRRMYELELYDMEPPEQIDVLAALTYRVMNTYAVQIHIEDTTEKATTIYKKVLQQKKEKKLYEVPKKKESNEEPSIDPYFVKNPIKAEDVEDEGIDLVSRVKKRKMLSEKHREGGSESGEEEEEEEEEGLVCKRIIEKLIGYQYSELFRHPVDVTIVPDYYDIVTRPISLYEIVGKIDGTNPDVGLPFPRSTRRSSHNNYTYELLMDDMKLLVDNAALYNSPDSYTMKQARRLELSFVRLCKENFDTDELVTRLNSLFKRK
uniref:Bromo domain-containing protein n=1 Tax=Ciona intestinalis TaxID=7719 RepID=F6PLM3_CIOIN